MQELDDRWIRDDSINGVCPIALGDPWNMQVSHLVIFLAVMPQCSDSFCYNCQAKLFLMVAGIYNDAVHLGSSCKHLYAALRAGARVVVSVSPECLDQDELKHCGVQGGHCHLSPTRPLIFEDRGKDILLQLSRFETPSYTWSQAWLCVCLERGAFESRLCFYLPQLSAGNAWLARGSSHWEISLARAELNSSPGFLVLQ